MLIHQRDGSVRGFDRMHVMAQMYLARFDAALGRSPHSSDVLDALENATPESRRAVEDLVRGGTFLDPYLDLEPRDPTAPPIEDLSEQAQQ